MYFDRGRLEDLRKLDDRLKQNPPYAERVKIQKAMYAIQHQAEDPKLNRQRELLLESRRRANNAKGEVNIQHERIEGDKLEERINKDLTNLS